MSIAQMYRQYIPFVGEYQYNDSGRPVSWYSPAQFIKGNVQPWKKGEALDLNAGTGTIVFKDWQVIYNKSLPDYDLTTAPSPLPADFQFKQQWVYLDNKWYAATLVQNWTRAGRGVKHYKWFISAQTGATTPDIPIPVPMADLVDDFENAVYETQQNSNLF